MKKSSWIVFCLTAFLAGGSWQTTAFGSDTDTVYNVASLDTFSAGGLGHYSAESSDTCTFSYSGSFSGGGTFDLYDGKYHFTGTYTLTKNGKQIALVLDTSGQAAVESNSVDIIQELAADYGVTLEDLSVTIQSIKLSTLSIKDGVPYKETSTIHGKASAIVGGKQKTKSFSHKAVKTNWELISGANP